MNKFANLFHPKQTRSSPIDSLEINTDHERRQLFLRYINRAWLVFGFVTLIGLFIFPEQRSEFVFLIALIFPTYLIIRFLNLAGRTRLAGVVLTLSVNFGFYGLFMVRVGELGASRAFETEATIWMLMGLAVLFAGAIVHKWIAPLLAALNSILLIVTRLSIAPHSDPRPSALVFWWMLALTIWLYEGTLHDALGRSWTEVRERKHAEMALRESVNKILAIFSALDDGITVANMDGQILESNDAAVKLHGFTTKEEYLNTNIAKLISETDRPQMISAARRILESGGSGVFVSTLRKKDGSLFDGELRMTRLDESIESMPAIIAITRDITERRQIEDNLRKAEVKYRTLVEQINPIVYTSSPHQHIGVTYVSPQIKTLGFIQEEWVADPELWLKQIHPDDREKVLQQIEEISRDGKPHKLEYRLRTRDGAVRWFLDEVMDIKDENGDILFRQGFMLDITERRKVEETIQTTNTLLEQTLEQSPVPMVLVSLPDGIIRSANSACRRFLGFDNEPSPVGTRLAELEISWQDFDMNGNPGAYEDLPLPRSLAGLKTDPQERQIVRKDGTSVYGLVYGSPIFDNAGSLIAGYLVMIDITERKQAEESLRISEERYRNLFNTMEEGVAINEAVFNETGECIDYIILDVNPAFERHSPYKMKNALGKRATELYRMSPEFISNWWREHTQKKQAAQTEYYHEPSGRWFFITTTIPADERFATLFSDITARKRAEEAIQQRLNEQTILHQVSQSLLTAHLDLETIYTTLHHAVVQIMPCEAFNIVLDDKNGGDYHAVYLFDVDHRFPSRRISRGQGLSGKVISDGETLFIHDNQQSNVPAVRYGTSNSVRSILAVPLRKENETIGMVTAQSYQSDVYNERHRVLLETLAAQVTTVIENARLFEETARRAQEFASLFETSNTLSAEYDLSALLRSIVENAKSLLHAASSGMYLITPGKDGLELTVDTQPYIPFGTRLQIGEGLAGRVAQTRSPLRVDDYSKWEGRSPLYEATPMRAVLEVPMLYKGELIGVLTADEIGDSTRKFTQTDEHLLSLFASQAAGAIHSARLREETTSRLRELGLLYESGLAFGQLVNPKVIAQKIIDLLDQKMDWHHTTIRLYHPQDETLELLAYNVPVIKDDQERVAIEERFRNGVAHSGQGLSGWVVQHGQVVRSNDLKDDPRYVDTFPGVRSGLYVPMMIADRVIGVISIEREEVDAFSESDERLTITLAAQAAIAIENAQLLDDLKHSNTNLTSAYDATIEGWSRAMDLRDKETEGHTLRVTDLTLKMARLMDFQEEDLIQIRRGGLLHDIGKLGIPDNILLKNENLTPEEWEIMRRHPRYAHEMLLQIDYLKPALDIPYCHHEKWDGSGYPRGLKGEEIPLVARIFAVVDVWDALTSDRPYRPSWTKAKSLKYIREQSGKHFDPAVVEAFMKLIADPK